MNKISNIIGSLPRKRHAELLVVLMLMLGGAIAQSALVTNTKPFLENVIHTVNLSQAGEQGNAALMACLTLGGLAILSGTLRLLSSWKSGEVNANISLDLFKKAYNIMLNDSYINHKNKNTADQIGDLRQIDNFTSGVMAPMIQIVSSATTIVGATYAALIVNTYATGMALSIVGVSYLAFTLLIRKRLKIYGGRVVEAARKEIKLQQESLGGIRDIILEGSQELHTDSFLKNANKMRMAGIKVGFLQTAPRYLIEMLGFIAFATIGYLSVNTGNPQGGEGVPTIGALAIAYQIALPNIQQIFSCWSSFRSSKISIDVVFSLTNEGDKREKPDHKRSANDKDVYTYDNWKTLETKDVEFRYKQTSLSKTLDSFSIGMKRGEKIGIVGETGGGKSTAVDILMGLLEPEAGEVLVDGENINKNTLLLEKWRNQVSHVPQNIFLVDGTVADNIAMAKTAEEIDWHQMKKCIEMADLEMMIENLEDGIRTSVGERGCKLSGGQKQRIGIARALYKEKSLLILDEATSALDYITEANIIKSINSLKHKPTIIIVAHRIETLKHCDKIYIIRKGKIKAQGSYVKLSIEDNYFKKLLNTKP